MKEAGACDKWLFFELLLEPESGRFRQIDYQSQTLNYAKANYNTEQK